MNFIKIVLPFFILLSLQEKGCNNKKSVMQQEVKGIDLQGHRGFRGRWPENTVPAMLAALDAGVHTLEMDIVISKDKQVVLSHEPWFSAAITTLPNGQYFKEGEEKTHRIYEMNYAEIIKYDVGKKGNPRFLEQRKIAAYKPSLSEVVDSVKSYCERKNIPFPYLNIETKCDPSYDGIFQPAPSEIVATLMAVIAEKNISEKVIIQSFDIRSLQFAYEHFPSIKLALLLEPALGFSLKASLQTLGFLPAIVSPDQSMLSKKFIDFCHKKGMKVIPWTVNEKKAMDRYITWGVDGIITDYPNRYLGK